MDNFVHNKPDDMISFGLEDLQNFTKEEAIEVLF